MNHKPSSRRRLVILILLAGAIALIAGVLFVVIPSKAPQVSAPVAPAPATAPMPAPSGPPALAAAEPGVKMEAPVEASTVEMPVIVTDAVAIRRGGDVSSGEPILDRRCLLEPTETIGLRLAIAATEGEVRVTAPNGGTFNARRGPLLADAAKLGGALAFDFTPGATRGRYTVEVTSGPSAQIIEFWVGEESPQGAPGPDLVFTGR